MACILYHEDKVLVTNEDFVPVIEIDETYPSCLTTDYHWLMKVACTWDDVKSLRSDMEKNSTSATHFRTKLLAAACQMQSALCLQDLGQLFHRPLRDSHGTVVVSCVNHVKVCFLIIVLLIFVDFQISIYSVQNLIYTIDLNCICRPLKACPSLTPAGFPSTRCKRKSSPCMRIITSTKSCSAPYKSKSHTTNRLSFVYPRDSTWDT